jgi:hypothetical protein
VRNEQDIVTADDGQHTCEQNCMSHHPTLAGPSAIVSCS